MRTQLLDVLVTLLEAVGAGRWKILMIRSGKSKNGNEYTPAVLKRAVKKGVFDGVAAQALRFSEGSFHHLPAKLREKYPQGFADVTVGITENAAWSDKHKGVIADLVLSDDHKWFESLLKLGKKVASTKWGWSINGGGSYEPNSKKVKEISILRSLDFVTHPSAGGKTLGPAVEEFALDENDMVILAESLSTELQELAEEKEHEMDKEQLKALLAGARSKNLIIEERYQELLALVESDADSVLTQLTESLAEAEENQPPEQAPQAPEAEADSDQSNRITEEAIEQIVSSRLDEFQRTTDLAEALARCQLPEQSQGRIRDLFEGRDGWTLEQLQKAINGEQEYVAQLTGRPVGTFGIQIGLAEEEKLVGGFAGLMECQTDQEAQVPAFSDLMESWVAMTGTSDLSNFPYIQPQSLHEGYIASNTWTNIVQLVSERSLAKMYRELPNVVTTIAGPHQQGTPDFHRHEIARMGGMGRLPLITGETDVLQPLSKPGDQKVYIEPRRYGGVLEVTREMMLNNDLGSVQRMLQTAAIGATKTLEWRLVTQLLIANEVWADGVALFHVNHNNINTSYNLTASPWETFESFESGMFNQQLSDLKASPSDLRVLGFRPYYMIVSHTGLVGAQRVTGADEKYIGDQLFDSSGVATTRNKAEGNRFKAKTNSFFGANDERILVSTEMVPADAGCFVTINPTLGDTCLIKYVQNRRTPWMIREVQNSGDSFIRHAVRWSVNLEADVIIPEYNSWYKVDTP